MRRPAGVEDVGGRPVCGEGTDGCDEGGGCEEGATDGEGLEGHD